MASARVPFLSRHVSSRREVLLLPSLRPLRLYPELSGNGLSPIGGSVMAIRVRLLSTTMLSGIAGLALLNTVPALAGDNRVAKRTPPLMIPFPAVDGFN